MKAFRCKLSGKVYEKTGIYETDDKDRAKELKDLGYLGAEIKEKKKAEKK